VPEALLQLLLGRLFLTFEGPAQRTAQVALAVEQFRQMMRPQFVVGTGDDSFGLVAGQQQDADRQPDRALLDGSGPGRRVAILGIRLDQEEVGSGFSRHQADVPAVEVFVGDQSDVPVLHALGQARTFFVGENAQIDLQSLAEFVQGSRGGSDETVQASPAQEVGEPAQAAGSAKEKNDEQGQDESAQKALPNAGAEEVFDFGLEVRVVAGLVA
jgi:hypothetical protein